MTASAPSSAPTTASVSVENLSAQPARTTAWRALLWKEWREVWPLAAVTCALLIPIAWWDLGPTEVTDSNHIHRSFVEEMQRGFLVLIPISAVVCGLLQFLRDRGPDAWGYIVHRGVTRSTWFHAKILVGAGALLVAWLLASAVVAVGCVWPGLAFVPMLPEFLAWSVGVMCVGLAAYAAGVATALGNGRWWASRCFPLAPFVVLASGFGASALAWSIPLALLLALVLLVIARGHWLAGPNAGVRRGWWLTTAPTWFMTIIIAGIAAIFVSRITPEGEYDEEGDNWTIDNSGRPLLLISHGFDTTMVDEDGQPVEGPVPSAHYTYLNDTDDVVQLPVNIWNYRQIVDGAVVQVYDPMFSGCPNVLSVLNTRAEIIAYNHLSCRRIPFQTPDGPVQSLHGCLRGGGPFHVRTIFDANGIIGLDEDTLTTKRIFTARPGETAYFDYYGLYQNTLPKEDPDKPKTQYQRFDGHLIQTDQRNLIFRAGQPDAEIPPILLHHWAVLFAFDDGHLATLTYDHKLRQGQDPILTSFDATGKAISTHRLTRPASLPPIPPRPSSFAPLDYLVPVPLDLFAVAGQIWKPDDADPIITWPIILVSAFIHLIAVLIARHRCRRHHLAASTTRRWTILIAITGWPGLIVFAVHADLPPLTACPRCAKPRSIANDHCGSCSGTWSDPPRLDAAGMAI